MAITRISPKRQITIPSETFKKLTLNVGDFLRVEVEEERIVLTPQVFIPKDQTWFWSKEWQRKEKEADGDIKAGKVSGPFSSGKELVKSLKAEK